ncbi:MAG: YIP1 family protein [Pseudomonadota bacterium]
MIGLLLTRTMEAYRDPRSSARRILDAGPNMSDALAMAVAGFVVSTLLIRAAEMLFGVTLIEALSPADDATAEEVQARVAQAQTLAALARQFLFHFLELGFISMLGWVIGMAAGGSASLAHVFILASWWSLAGALLLALGQIAILALSPAALSFGMFVAFAALLYFLFLFAAFLAEAHNFESEAAVFVIGLGVLFALTLVTAIIFGSMSG